MMEFSAVNTIWVLLGAALVFFMQAGFAMVETGFTRAKNAGNIIMKNLMDFAIGTPLFWLTGFGIMFGGAGAFIGGFDPLVRGDYSGILPAGVPLPAYLIFQTVFCATAATIVSGAMAERTKFISYCIYSAVISAVVYPVSGHWIWGGGWLARMGFHDFAGSTAVHMCGGAAALIGARILGPRIGKYTEDGKPNAILGHSLTLGALGVFHEQGIRIPEDLEMLAIAMMDSEYSEFSYPPLSTINMPIHEIMNGVITILMEQIRTNNDTPVHVMAEAGVTLRKSF